jgi:DNA-binding MarR family transcriptional regulator
LLKGLVKKAPCSTDKRLVDVSISEKGKKLLEKLDKFETDIDAILANLSESEITTLNKILDKIRS